MAVFVPFNMFGKALDLSADERKNFDALLNHIMTGLAKEDLISKDYVSGKMERHRKWPSWQSKLVFGL